MSKKQVKKYRITTIASALALVAFVGVAMFATISVTSIASLVEGNIVANKNGVPTEWESLSKEAEVTAKTESKVVSNDYVQYVASIKNEDDSTLSLTHVSSYVTAESSKGFVPLAENTLEYTYDPINANSWTPVKISAPENSEEGFKLDTSLYLGETNSNTDTIYFRYNVSPTEEGTVSDTVAFVTKDWHGDVAVTVSENTVEYQKAVSENANDNIEVADPESGDGTYAKPLGVSSEAPSASVVNAATLGAISVSEETITPSIIVMLVALGIFALALVVYLVVRSKDNKSKAKK